MAARSLILAAAALVAGLGGGVAYERLHGAATPSGGGGEKKILYWVEPMDPNYRRDKPGKSPMGMDLIPVYEGEEPGGGAQANDDAGVVRLSPAVSNNIGVRTGAAQRARFAASLRTVGYVALNEDRTSHVHVRKEGWIESLRVRSLGAEVRRGDLLFEFFAPEVASASYEYVRDLERGGLEFTTGGRVKLKALGVSDRQIDEIRASRKPADRVRVYAPQDGVVTALTVGEGMFIKPDQTVMTLSDLSSVWVIADVFESQSSRIVPGMAAEARLAHLPDDVWRGQVDYVYPDLDPTTRTLRVRLQFANPGLKLRPNMYADVTLQAEARDNVLAVPSEAVIRTGRGSNVVLALGDGRFRAVPVKAGAVSDGRTEILGGLDEGARVVLSGQFLIDSEASLKAGFARMDEPVSDPPAAAVAVVAETIATVNAVDAAGRTINVTHGPIPALGWPGMTMDFTLAPGVAVDGMAAGAKVRLGIGRDAAGTFIAATVTPEAAP